jgi:arylsulfatase
MEITRRSLLQTAAGAAAALPLAARQSKPERPPNIVLILADDMGYSDIGSYGSEIATPHLDRLSGQGVRFTQFYNCARCCPSRASLLSGLYPHQAGIGHMVDKEGPLPGYANDLSPACRTIPEVLKSAHYQTFMAGKWHVTPVTQSKHNWPLQRGFDHYYGIIHGAADYFNPVTLTNGNEFVEPEPNYYFTDALGDRASRFISEAGKTDRPYFLYSAFTAPHWPLHALDGEIEKYRDRYKDGWDALREERHERQLKAGLLPKRWDLSPRDAIAPAWKDAPSKEWQIQRMAVYAAMVDRLDQNIGKILRAVTESGQEENTLVCFMSDNGGCAEELGPTAGGLHVPKKARDGSPVKVGNLPVNMPGHEDTYQSYGLPWANASNTPFRLYKHWVHEGGISTPLIMSWPNQIKPSRQTIPEPCHFVDMMATFVGVSGATYPSEANGHAIRPMQGHNLLPLIKGHVKSFDRTVYWEHEGNQAARRGRWKLVRKYPGEYELYDIEADRTELHDRAKDQPKILAELKNSWDAWAKDSGVLPWDQVEKALHGRSA